MTYRLEAPLGALAPIGDQPPHGRDARFAPGPAELCQLAGTWTGERLSTLWLMEEKHDGIRLLWLDGEFVTREGVPFSAAEHLRPMFERIQARCGLAMMLDAEFVVQPDRPGQSVFLTTLAAFKRGEPGAGTAWLFDGMPLGDWQGGGCPRSLILRRRRLEGAFDGLPAGPVALVEQWGAWSPEDVARRRDAIWARGGEGLVLKHKDEPYRRARTGSWLKVKRELQLQCTVDSVLKDGAALRVVYDDRKLNVAVPPPLRGQPPAPGDQVTVAAMEWTEKGALRQGRLESISLRGGEEPPKRIGS